jgi:cytosine/adenosine deaminase-related metal-dependent hydrolase
MISQRNVHVVGSGVHFDFENAIAFPGLINSHDHLDFNLFPRLGNRVYANCVEWGEDIHKANRTTIDEVLKVPQHLRTQWGVYKNLLNGVTTVVNHGEPLQIDEPVIDVFQHCDSIHSVRQEKHWALRLNKPLSGDKPVVMHLGEGTDEPSTEEITTLLQRNFLRRKVIAVHGVAMTAEQARNFAALVWCPDSNYFLLNRTADIPRLQKETTIVFGTDSTLTAHWNLWEQLRAARALRMITDEALFHSVTSVAAGVWGLPSRQDIVVARRTAAGDDFDSWFAINPEDILIVIQDGRVRLIDDSIPFDAAEKYSRVAVGNSVKRVQGDLTGLMAEVKRHSPNVAFPIESVA